MGTTRSGRYFLTKGSRIKMGDFAVVHAVEGKFKRSQVRVNGKITIKLRLEDGGHGQKGMDLLDKYGIEYHVVKTYSNGVRVGYVPNHLNKLKKNGIGQSWFPKTWDAKTIKRAAEHVAGLKRNRNVPDGVTMYGTYKGVKIGVKRTNGRIATAFPDSNQKVL